MELLSIMTATSELLDELDSTWFKSLPVIGASITSYSNEMPVAVSTRPFVSRIIRTERLRKPAGIVIFCTPVS